MRIAALLLATGCSVFAARSPASPQCSTDYGPPLADSVIAFVAAGVTAFGPGLARTDRARTDIGLGAASVTVAYTASLVYGYAIVDPDRCRPK